MTRTELALSLLSALERSFDGLVHPWGPNQDAYYAAGDVIDTIVSCCDGWSRGIWERGGYEDGPKIKQPGEMK